jgi:hypothetical protein
MALSQNSDEKRLRDDGLKDDTGDRRRSENLREASRDGSLFIRASGAFPSIRHFRSTVKDNGLSTAVLNICGNLER